MFILAVLGLAVLIGLLGRLFAPGRHGLLNVVVRDLRLLPRILVGTVPGRVGIAKALIHDIGLRWALGASLVGGFAGYAVGDHLAAGGWHWLTAIGGAVVLLAVLLASDQFRKTAKTRRLGVHRGPLYA